MVPQQHLGYGITFPFFLPGGLESLYQRSVFVQLAKGQLDLLGREGFGVAFLPPLQGGVREGIGPGQLDQGGVGLELIHQPGHFRREGEPFHSLRALAFQPPVREHLSVEKGLIQDIFLGEIQGLNIFRRAVIIGKMQIITAARWRHQFDGPGQVCKRQVRQGIVYQCSTAEKGAVLFQEAKLQVVGQYKNIIHIVFAPAHGIQALPGPGKRLFMGEGRGVVLPNTGLRQFAEGRLRMFFHKGFHAFRVFGIKRIEQ